MRKTFQMSQAQLDTLLAACAPVPYIVAGGMEPPSPRARANAAWVALGAEMGFDGMTAEPVRGKDERWFTAEALLPPSGGEVS